MKIDPFRYAEFYGSTKKHAMREDSEYTLCRRSTAGENSSVWDAAIPEWPTCSQCLSAVMTSPIKAVYGPGRAVMAYVLVRGFYQWRGDFDVRVSSYLRCRAEGWGLKEAAVKARFILDPDREKTWNVQVLNPETLMYEGFDFEPGSVLPVQ